MDLRVETQDSHQDQMFLIISIYLALYVEDLEETIHQVSLFKGRAKLSGFGKV